MATILIADDDLEIRTALQTLLERDGYNILTAADGNRAVEIFHSHKPDLVIIDIIMPFKAGLDTISEIKEEFPDTKIIAMSGGGVVSANSYLSAAKGSGALFTISKPFKSQEILNKVKELLMDI